MTIEKDFSFDSAHFLPNTPPGHKCGRLHGHTYLLTVGIKSNLLEVEQWVMDFGDIKKVVNPLIENLDHQLLNSIPGLENPTAEIMAKYIYNILKPDLPELHYIKVQETPTARSIYYGDEK
ncbi:MAG: 6-carboxytetrahydropterin synthase QueD [Spirochaetia bacterium]|nr:6-carboxytetrahydropterin synthase QueD [Spirochaetia bacterium]